VKTFPSRAEPRGQVTKGTEGDGRGLLSPFVPFCHQSPNLKTQIDPASKVLAAIRAGHRRPGPIARAAGLGVTCTYQTIDALRAAGRIVQALGGKLTEASEVGNGRPRVSCARRWLGWAAMP
jgi:hypothetical protein